MTTTKYSFNLTRTLRVYQSMLRRYRGLGLLYGFLSFVALPLQYLLNMLSPNHIRPDSGLFGPSLAYNGVSAVLYFTLMFLMPLVLGIAMTEYMQQKRSVDVYHSLPVTREELLGGTAAAAVTILFIPLFLSFGLVMGMAGVNIGASAMGPLFQEALCWAACSFATLALTVFAAVNVGSSFDGTVFAIALNVIFTVISLINVGLADLFLYGYNGSERAVMFAVKLSPFSAMIARQTFSLGMTDFAEKLAENNLVCLLWFLAAVVFSLLSMHLYKKRKSEAAEVVGNYGALSLFIRAAGYYIVAVGMGAIFYGVLSRNDGEPFGYFTIGSLVGVLVAYLVIEVILSRGLKTVIRRLPVCLAAMLCMTVVSWGFHSGGFGFETRLPDPAKVRSVGISYTGRYDGAGSYKGQLTLENAESVAAVLQAHGALVAGRDDARGEEDRQDPYRYSNYVSLSLEYTMQNGSVMERRYYDRLPDEARQALASLEVNAEFIEQVHPVFGLDAKTIQGISIIDVLNTNSTYKELSAEDNQKLLEALRRDLQNATLESITHPEGPALGYIQIHYIREDLLQAIETTLPYPESPENTPAPPMCSSAATLPRPLPFCESGACMS